MLVVLLGAASGVTVVSVLSAKGFIWIVAAASGLADGAALASQIAKAKSKAIRG